VTVDAARGLLAAHRPGVSVLVNLGAEAATLALPDLAGPLTIIGSEPGLSVQRGAATLPPVSVALVAQDAAAG
jgi:hypothetical protein